MATLIAILVGAVGSVALTLYAGRHNASRVLPMLFALWVLSPFVVLLGARRLSKNWSALTRATLSYVALAITLGTLAIYAYVAFGPPRSKPASAFVMIPPASWLLIAIAIPLAAFVSRRRSR